MERYQKFIKTMTLLIVPALALAARRLHDTGRSAWWLLISLTGIGGILLFIWYLMPGTEGENKYGPDPKASDSNAQSTEIKPAE